MHHSGRIGSAPGPFSTAAIDLCQRGLAVIPVGDEDGKRPLVKWARWKRPPGRAFIAELIENHGHQNIGVLCGLSKVTVVDIDDAALADQMLSRCGPTPLVTETPSGGLHLWYRSSGEQCANLRQHEDLAVDVKAAGGLVVAPPSIRPAGPHAGKIYRIVRGSWDDLARLPTVTPGSLRLGSEARFTAGGRRPGPVVEGARNSTIFRELLRQAGGCATIGALGDAAHGLNAALAQPLGSAEIGRLVASAWRYEDAGSNWTGQEPHIVTTASELAVFAWNADAYLLRSMLQAWHGAQPGEPFAISPLAMREADLMPGWGQHRYLSARTWLLEHGFLVLVHSGGHGAGDPSTFALAAPGSVGKVEGRKGRKELGYIVNSSGVLNEGRLGSVA